MSARERLQDMVRTERGDMNVYSQPEVRTALDAYRTEVLAEVTAWLVKKAREYRAGVRDERVQADTAAVLASKIARGAVRPNNLRMLPDPGFFEVDRVYTSGSRKFRCEAVSASPGTGERRALGWQFAPVNGVHHWYAVALDSDDWAHGGWGEGGGSDV